MKASFPLEALNLYDSIRLKSVRNILSGKLVHSAPHEIQLQYGNNQHLFIYRFGCVVFYNMTAPDMERELDRLKTALGSPLPEPTTESYVLIERDGPTQIDDDYSYTRKITPNHIRLTAVTLGQSAALEYFEVRSDRMLYDTSSLMQNMARVGVVPFSNKRLLKIIGSTASTRQHIISNMSILDPPEETWKSKELANYFDELQKNFDIDLRFRTLDRKLTLVQDNIEIMADLTASRRSTFLEAMIVVLIVMELAIVFIFRM